MGSFGQVGCSNPAGHNCGNIGSGSKHLGLKIHFACFIYRCVADPDPGYIPVDAIQVSVDSRSGCLGWLIVSSASCWKGLTLVAESHLASEIKFDSQRRSPS